MHAALTIAGSDSGGGAGIQSDLRTFAAYGVHGLSALTAVTAQNTHEISRTQPLTPEVVAAQITTVAADFPIAAAKTGMLANRSIVAVVCERLQALSLRPVVDPVLVSTSGGLLLDESGLRLLKARLLPLASVVTPNRMEAERLSGTQITSLAGAREAARRIRDLGAAAVIVTGGHLDGTDTVVDVLDDGAGVVEIATTRVGGPAGSSTHGTGCAFSAALTAGLATGLALPAAAEDAQRYVAAAIRQACRFGRGRSVLGHGRPGAARAGVTGRGAG